MRRLLISLAVVAAVVLVIVLAGGTSSGPGTTYKIELNNAFGLVTGADFKIAGVTAGSIQSINLDQKDLNAVVTVDVTGTGIPPFHTSATCESEPQSLIGEYFISCEPGETGPLIKYGATIPVSHTTSTIPADLLLDVFQVPERERLPMIINALGAGVAARSGDLQSALDRAVPALTETDDLLQLLASDSGTINNLTVNANTVVSALANNTSAVQRFIDYADRAATDTAAQSTSFKTDLQEFPGFLAQLQPAMRRLGQATSANLPAVENLNASSSELARLFTLLPGFDRSAKPAIAALGKASVTGKVAIQAAGPAITALGHFAQPTPELAKNLSIVLPDLDTLKNVTEKNARSPGGNGYTGLEALLQFVFNLSVATNYYGPTGHMLGVDGFISAMCTPYATPQTVADSLATYGSAYRSCYSFLGKTQPGVNTTDPSDPSACVPDPGGAPPGKQGPVSDNCKLAGTDLKRSPTHSAGLNLSSISSITKTLSTLPPVLRNVIKTATTKVTKTLSNIGNTLTQVLTLLGNNGSGHHNKGPTLHGLLARKSSHPSAVSETQTLLDYLLSP
jgi:virulence factor Mce-like protein